MILRQSRKTWPHSPTKQAAAREARRKRMEKPRAVPLMMRLLEAGTEGRRFMGIFSFVSLCRAGAGRRRPAVLLIIIASGQRAFKENGKSMFFYTRGIVQKIC